MLRKTVRTYLENGMRQEQTARALIVHRNTLKYRLARFEGITGADLNKTEDIIEIWWALQRRTVDAALGAPTANEVTLVYYRKT